MFIVRATFEIFEPIYGRQNITLLPSFKPNYTRTYKHSAANAAVNAYFRLASSPLPL
jgi:hypothetical protein